MSGVRVGRVSGVSLRIFVVATMVLGLVASPAVRTASSTANAAVAVTGAVSTVQAVVLDSTFAPLPRGQKSPWDGEFVLDGIDGLSYNTPGTEVKVRAMSSNAGFVNEVWLVYPRVQYLFNSKDIADLGNEFSAMQFSDWISVGTFPPGTELIFGVKTNVGIDDKCQDRVNGDGSVDRHHCYEVTQSADFVPLAPDPVRECTIADDPCRNRAWPSLTPDGKTIFYTGPGVRNVKDDSPHGRFQYLTNTKADGTGAALTNTALFGLEDVGAPQVGCPGAKELESLFTTTDVNVSAAAQTIGLSSVAGLAPGEAISIYQPFQRETVAIASVDGAAKTITAVFTNPDNKPYPAGTNWAPEGCDWHPDFQDAGVVVWPALAATCSATAVQNKVEIVGQEGYGTVTLRDGTQTYAQTFAPGDKITFTFDDLVPAGVSGSSPNWTINRSVGTVYMVIADESKPVGDPNRTLDGGICYDPGHPPLPLIETIAGTFTCDTGWDFTITGVNANTAPPSIRVTWTNDQTPPADEAATIPLTSVGTDGVAHYQSTLHTSLRVVSATTTKPTTAWTGNFKLASGPCGEIKTADLSLACAAPDATRWDITITGTTQAQAPAKIAVSWSNGASADLLLDGKVLDGDGNAVDPNEAGTAHYGTSANLEARVTAATATIQGAWAGEFKVNGAPCPISAQVQSFECDATAWRFRIAGISEGDAPASILVSWGAVTETVTRTSFSGDAAVYETALHLDLAVTGATAVIAAEPTSFALTHGPCSTHVRPPTLTDHECDVTEWHFVITQLGAESAPGVIIVVWTGGASEAVPLWKVTGSTAHYRTTSNLDRAVTDAMAPMAVSP